MLVLSTSTRSVGLVTEFLSSAIAGSLSLISEVRCRQVRPPLGRGQLHKLIAAQQRAEADVAVRLLLDDQGGHSLYQGDYSGTAQAEDNTWGYSGGDYYA